MENDKSKCFPDMKEVVVQQLADFTARGLLKKPACYLIENEATGKMYVGSTSNAGQRLLNHHRNLKNGQHHNYRLQQSYNKTKDVTVWKVHIALMESSEQARDHEQLILDASHGHPDLLNISDSARSGSTGYDNQQRIQKMIQTKNTPEYKQKTSATSRAMWEREGYRENHIRTNGDNVTVDGIEYGSVRQASRETGVSIPAIRKRLNDGVCSLVDLQNTKRRVSVSGIIYASVIEAANALGLAANTMTWRCQNTNERWADHFYLD